MLEVEVKAHVNDFSSIKSRLNEIGASYDKSEHQEDVYYNAPHRDYAETDEALRIRKIPGKEGSKYILTYKGAKLDDKSKTRREIEVEVDDRDKTASLLENIGFRPVRTIKKDRISYLLDQFIITLDKVYQVGNFVEIEKGMEEDEDYQDIIQEIYEIYRILGIKEGFERRSYMELLELKQNGVF